MVLTAGMSAGCTVKSFDSGNTVSTGTATRINAARVVVSEAPDSAIEGKAVIASLIALAANKYIQNTADARKVSDRELFLRTFTEGFKSKFPAEAAKYGLTISDDAAAEFRFVVGNQQTMCSLYGCASNFEVQGTLNDAAGKEVWHVSGKIGQATVFAHLEEAFDEFAAELIAAWKKDGVVGSGPSSK